MVRQSYITLFLAILIGTYGYLIQYKRKIKLIKGINLENVSDKDGLLDWVGSHLLIVSAVAFVVAFLGFIFPAKETLFGFLFYAFVAFFSIRISDGTTHF